MRTQRILHAGTAMAGGAAIAVLFAACSGTVNAPVVQTEPAEIETPSAEQAEYERLRQERMAEDLMRAASPDAEAERIEIERLEASRNAELQAQQGQLAGFVPEPAESTDETVIVTGTRLRRDDFSAVNATTVITADEMQALGVTSVADMIAQLPENTPVQMTTDQIAELGLDVASLRGLNTATGTRTLVLVDSSRFVPTDSAGQIDLNMVPTALIGQIETVTGGASATYGADAMAGIVNVIIMPQAEPRRGPPGRQIGGVATQATEGSEAGGFGGSLDEAAEERRLDEQEQREAEVERLREAERRRQEEAARAREAEQQRLAELARAQAEREAEERRVIEQWRAEQEQYAQLDREYAARRQPLSRVVPGEEIWVISQEFDEAEVTVADDALGSGVMIARVIPAVYRDSDVQMQPQVREIPLPLKHTDVDATIHGYVGTVDVTQQFENPYSEKIEAVYMFPLPEKAAVSEFVMQIGERRIRGILRDKQEAQQIYQQARAQGYQASLLTQHRPNVFEQKVANIEPGKQIDVNIRYYETLAYADGWYSFVFPTVVGPRYNPPGSADPLLAVPRTQNGTTGGDAVRYLAPNERSVHDVSINVEIDAGVAIEAIDSSHELTTSELDDGVVSVALADGSMLPNRDFRLDFRVAGDEIKSNLLTYVDDASGSGYFTLMMYPPAGLERLDRQPLEMVFVLDTSGSMNGAPIEQSKAAVIAALDRLEPTDTFQIIRFSQSASQFGAEPVLATSANIQSARRYVRQLSGSGGTQMIEGIRAALNFPHDDDRLRFVTFLTDGYIGNEAQILDAIDSGLGASRIFSFGVGSSPNRYLLERMAGVGRGAVAWLSLEQSGAEVMDAFFDRIAHPAMIDVEIDWGDMLVEDVYPSRMPDLFVGRPVVVTGRFSGAADDVRMLGRASGQRVNVALNRDDNDPQHSFLPNLWARLKIAELNDQLAIHPQNRNLLGAQIRETALEYELMSDYTSFVAVDASQPTEGSRGTTVYQAVPVPDGVRYETTVGR